LMRGCNARCRPSRGLSSACSPCARECPYQC
jgi:hypothetical protein